MISHLWDTGKVAFQVRTFLGVLTVQLIVLNGGSQVAANSWLYCIVEPVMSSQPPIGGHLAISRNDISYTNEPPMSSHLP